MNTPEWVPKSAVTFGWKVVTSLRDSVVPSWYRGHPYCQLRSERYTNNPSLSSAHSTYLNYPRGRKVTAHLCLCDNECCEGIHFFSSVKDAVAWREQLLCDSSPIVRCYVPKGGTFIKINNKCRSDSIICLDTVDRLDQIKEHSHISHEESKTYHHKT